MQKVNINIKKLFYYCGGSKLNKEFSTFLILMTCSINKVHLYMNS